VCEAQSRGPGGMPLQENFANMAYCRGGSRAYKEGVHLKGLRPKRWVGGRGRGHK